MTMKLTWNQACCEQCWLTDVGRTEDDEVRRPVRVVGDALRLEQCSFCGRHTIFGVYVRRDPATVPFPRVEEDDE